MRKSTSENLGCMMLCFLCKNKYSKKGTPPMIDYIYKNSLKIPTLFLYITDAGGLSTVNPAYTRLHIQERHARTQPRTHTHTHTNCLVSNPRNCYCWYLLRWQVDLVLSLITCCVCQMRLDFEVSWRWYSHGLIHTGTLYNIQTLLWETVRKR